MTSTLQQEASRKLRFSAAAHDARRPAPLRERLHHLHAHRLDLALGDGDRRRRATQARELYGADAVPAEPRHYNRKVKNAQEAHEAIRPAGDRFRTPDEVAARARARRGRALRPGLEAHRRLADGRRARRDRLDPDRRDRDRRPRRPSSRTAGTVITFRGFLLAYEEGRDEAVAADESERALPPLDRGRARSSARGARARVALDDRRRRATPRRRSSGRSRSAASAARRPTPRSSARSSTAATCARSGQALVPTFLAFAVTNLLEQHFGAARRLRVHRADGGRPRPDRRRATRSAAPGSSASTSATAPRRRGPEGARLRPRRDRRPLDQHDRDRQRDRASRRPLGPLHRARTASGSRSATTSRPTSSRSSAPRSSSRQSADAARARRQPRDRPDGHRQERAATAPT